MRSAAIRRIALLAAAAGVVRPALAHHSNAPFDLNEVIQFDATVTRFEWKNPHVFVHVETVDASGNLVQLQVEGDGTAVLIPVGWSRTSLRPGDQITVSANPPRNPNRKAVLGRRLIKADGSELFPNPEFIETATPRSNDAAQGFAGIWLPRREDFYALLRSVNDWSLTQKGQRFLDAYDGTQNPQADCIPVSAPVIMVYMVHTELEVLDDRIVMHSDWMDVERTIYLDGREHPSEDARSRQGHTVGHWEGDTLVTDTQRFAEHSGGLVVGVPSGLDKRIVERLTLAPDGTALIYEFELTDPEYLLEPVTGTARWDYRPDLSPSASACDIEAAQRFLEQPLE